jgi:hypothetical protein
LTLHVLEIEREFLTTYWRAHSEFTWEPPRDPTLIAHNFTNLALEPQNNMYHNPTIVARNPMIFATLCTC